MRLTKKLLTTTIATLLLTFSFGATAYASELDTTTVTEQTTTEASDDTLSTDTSIEEQTAEITLQNVVEGGNTEENMDLLLQEGYFIDEQGELNYEAPVAEETIAEEAEDVLEEAEDKEVVVEKPSYSESDLRLLTCLIYSEAGNQNYNGMLAVANVVLNRVKSDVYWHANTIKEVIYDNKWSTQFAVTIKGRSGVSMMDKALKIYDSRKFTGSNPEAQKKALNKAIKAAKAALTGTNNIGSYLCFQNKRSASSIKRKYSDYEIIDDHIFYRNK
ncbi:MAG: hypothetical protein K0R46_2778 [Herbinix sp.]|jgi:spore germination cell wall hydrolase CwlJ-like protein|nr:hypothetical protein [Herbinix sp.]